MAVYSPRKDTSMRRDTLAELSLERILRSLAPQAYKEMEKRVCSGCAHQREDKALCEKAGQGFESYMRLLFVEHCRLN